jgi:tungstate transport system ATP-binding protein
MTGSAIECKGVSKAYDGNPILANVDLKVDKGDILAIIGPSGVGKTTLLRLMNGLERPDSGTVSIGSTPLTFDNGRDLPVLRRMAYILQKPVAFSSTVFDNVAFGLRVRGVLDVEGPVERALEMVGLLDLSDRMAPKLSGGEMQRMAFARATVFGPSILLLDEFTANLDPQNVALLEDAVLRYHEEKDATVVIVTHNLFQAKRVSRTATLMLDGGLVEQGPTKSLFEEPESDRTRAYVSGEMVF